MSIAQRIAEIEEEMNRTQKNKATEGRKIWKVQKLKELYVIALKAIA